MIHQTEPMPTARIQNPVDLIRSMTEPDTIDAAVQENSRKAAQNTPLIRAQPVLQVIGATHVRRHRVAPRYRVRRLDQAAGDPRSVWEGESRSTSQRRRR